MVKVSEKIKNLNPLTKLIAVFVLGLSTLVFPSPWLGFGIVFLLMLVAFTLDLLPAFSKLIFGFGFPLTIMLLFIQGFYSPKNTVVLLDMGFAELGLEGTMYALKLVSILLVFMGAFFLMNQTTPTSSLVTALMKSGLNAKVGYLVLASLNVVPQMNRRVKIIQEAQEARGVNTQGNLIHRFKSFLPLIGPVVLSSFTDAQERGMTLETRGFAIRDVRVTSLTEVSTSMIDYIVRSVLLLLLVAAVIIRFL